MPGDRRSYRYVPLRSLSKEPRKDDGKASSSTTAAAATGAANPDEPKFKPVGLKDIMSANPGISMPEAVVRLNAYNTAVARGEEPPSLTGALPINTGPAILPLGMNHMAGGPVGVNALAHSLGGGEGGAATKPHRELYIGNLPPGITVPQLAEFINSAMKQLGYSKDANSVITAWVSPDGHFAFVEVRTLDEAMAALTHLNGIQVGAYALRIGRPKGYSPTLSNSAVAVPMQGAMAGLNSMSLVGGVGLGGEFLCGCGCVYLCYVCFIGLRFCSSFASYSAVQCCVSFKVLCELSMMLFLSNDELNIVNNL